MKRFGFINNVVGWSLFLFSFIVYTLTVERTGSLWDCGEFIAVSYKLQVSHPPGAPFYMLLGRLFSLFAFGDTQNVALAVNMLSVISSAFTILFLFWTIVLLAQKFVKTKNNTYTSAQIFQMMLAGAIGALCYTFSDSFWFSAAEAEVYATSSFFTAFVMWAILKWEHIKDPAASNRWLILIFYMMGLSIGVHLLNLTALPALGLVYYFNKYQKVTAKGIIATLAVCFGLIFIFMIVIIQIFPSIAGSIEIFFVNNFGWFFGSGVLFFALVLLGGFIYGIYVTHRLSSPIRGAYVTHPNRMVIANTFLLGFLFVIIGYSSYLIIPIRSSFDPPIDENDPEDVITFLSYLKREQYGSRPLLYGQTYDAKPVRYEKVKPLYRKAQDKYEIYDYRYEPVYSSKDKILLPRIYSKQGNHVQLYKNWMNLKGNEKPTFIDNLYYMFRYQINHMYIRYFMWNFAGRESDIKEAEWLYPWETNDDKPYELKINKGYSNFYMLPLLLGLLGLFFQYEKRQKTFYVVLTFFILTGVATLLYLNPPPVEPRERDYTYVGSFYAFAIWIGFGAFAVVNWVKKLLQKETIALGLATLLCLLPPFLMAKNGWDNHDRSNRFHSAGQARNALASCAPNAILFTGGDNDTFPLWYVQEVEGFRTDVRVIVLSYFNTNWYIKQMRRDVYESKALPISLPQKAYFEGSNDYLPVTERYKKPVNAAVYIDLIRRDHPDIKAKMSSGSISNAVLSRGFFLDIESTEKDLVKTFTSSKLHNRILDRMVWSLKPNVGGMMKSDLAMLDIIVNNKWKRPIYFNNTSLNNISVDLSQYCFLEGMTYRLLPVKVAQSSGEVNTDIMLENIKKFDLRGLNDPTTYNDEDFRRFIYNERYAFYRLGRQLEQEGRKEEALEVLRMSKNLMSDNTIPFDYLMTNQIKLYYNLGSPDESEELASLLQNRSVENLNYWLDKDPRHTMVQTSIYMLYNITQQYGEIYNDLVAKMGSGGSEIEVLQASADLFKQRLDASDSIFREFNARIESVRGSR